MKIEIEQEVDGRWIADVSELPGVMAYGQTRVAAIAKVKALALRVLADRWSMARVFLTLLTCSR
ncbi:MAG: hypothetical protein L0Z50_13720 [Verrucomicrobiales bacterium]|nr:hypothetical protein [Verrucomicrobiales bacterium]